MRRDPLPRAKEQGVVGRGERQIAEALQAFGSVPLAGEHAAEGEALSFRVLEAPAEIEKAAALRRCGKPRLDRRRDALAQGGIL